MAVFTAAASVVGAIASTAASVGSAALSLGGAVGGAAINVGGAVAPYVRGASEVVKAVSEVKKGEAMRDSIEEQQRMLREQQAADKKAIGDQALIDKEAKVTQEGEQKKAQNLRDADIRMKKQQKFQKRKELVDTKRRQIFGQGGLDGSKSYSIGQTGGTGTQQQNTMVLG